MRTLRNLLAVSGAALVWGMPADAAAQGSLLPNLPEWTGIYAGLNAGYMDSGQVNGLLTTGRAPKGFTPGFRLGADLQFQNFVFGAFADVSRSFASSKTVDPLNVVGGVAHTEKWGQSTNVALNARFGYVMGPSLIYATAGYNWGSMNAAATVVRNVSGTPRNVLERYNTSADGFNMGLGLEFRVFRGWTVFGEYRYVFAQKPAVALSTGTIPPLSTGESKVTLGVNHRF